MEANMLPNLVKKCDSIYDILFFIIVMGNLQKSLFVSFQ